MRVGTKSIFDMVKYNLSNITDDMVRANQVVATGKRINSLSDDPIDLSQALKLKSSVRNMDQLKRNLMTGNLWLDAADTSLRSVQDLITEAKVLGIQMANTTADAAQRNGAAKELQNIIDEIVSLANTEVNGRYIFSGAAVDTVPFEWDGTYNGDKNGLTIKVGNNATVTVGGDGESVFGSLFTNLRGLKDALSNNDANEISASVGKIGGDFDHLSSQVSEVGAKQVRLQIKSTIFEDLAISTKDNLSRIEDADIAAAITDLKSKEVIYQAALAASEQIMSLSLVNFIG